MEWRINAQAKSSYKHHLMPVRNLNRGSVKVLKQRIFNFMISFFIIALLSTSITNTAFAATSTTPSAAPVAQSSFTGSTVAAPTKPAVATNAPVGVTAGQVIITSGTFTASNLNKQIRALVRGDNFYSGDTLITGPNSKAQVRYTDGTVLALDPDSQFKVIEYHYQQAGAKDKNFATLVKGGFRALTGLISKHDPTAYQVDTSVAAIAVRGTSFGASLKGGQLFIGVWKGKIVVENQAGEIILGEGQNYSYATVTAADSSPVGLLSEPNALAGRCIQTPG